MQNEVSSDKKYEILIKYFNKKFHDSKIESIQNYGEERTEWYGLVKDSDLIIGRPKQVRDYEYDDKLIFFSNGHYFGSDFEIFGIDYPKFHEYMKTYLNMKYGLNIYKII
jgi:hypothetical protein